LAQGDRTYQETEAWLYLITMLSSFPGT